jgi:hypothetical protein
MKKLLILSFILLSGCISQRRIDKICQNCPTKTVTKDSITTVTQVVTRDTTIQLPADSAWYRLWLQCDTSDNVVVVKSEVKSGVKTEIKYILKDNIIQSTCFVDSADVVLKWNEKHTTKTVNHEKESVLQPKKRSFWSGLLLFVLGLVVGALTATLIFTTRPR